MCRKFFASFATLFLVLLPGLQRAQEQSAPSPDEFQRGERTIRRFPPSEFKNAPQWVVVGLVALGCTIPQPFAAQQPSNLIRGQFARNGEWDWAAICSKEGKSRAVVLWDGPPACPNSFGESEDVERLATFGSGGIGYEYSIVSVGPEQIRKDIHDWGDPSAEEHAKAISHDGIELPSGKGVQIEYCLRGQWTIAAAGD